MKDRLIRFLALAGSPVVALALVVASTLCFHQKTSQSPVWLAPYLSGAANWAPGREWLVDPASVDQLKPLDTNERWNHRFQPADNRTMLVKFESMDPGWMWVVWVARNLMPFWGDLCAISVLTLVLHHALAALACRQLASPETRGAFVLLYLANPLVIYVVSMPYYYGWQAIASLAALNIVFAARKGEWAWQLPLTALLLLCVAIRPNVLTITAPAVIYASFVLRGKSSWASAVPFAVGVLLIPKINKPFWHTAYCGLGAYPNNHGLYLSDDSSSAAYEKATGERWTARIGGSFHDPVFRRRFNAKMQELTLEIVKADPMLPVRNVTLNLLIALAWVYKPGLPYWFYLAQALLGLLVAILLASSWRSTWAPILAFGVAVGPVVIIHPPIAVYVVGGYCFLALGLAYVVEDKSRISE